MLLVYNKSAEKENIYNISLGDQISVREIAELVAKRFSPKAKIKYGKTSYGWPGDIEDTFLSNKKITEVGFKPKYKTSREVIMHTIEANRLLYKNER